MSSKLHESILEIVAEIHAIQDGILGRLDTARDAAVDAGCEVVTSDLIESCEDVDETEWDTDQTTNVTDPRYRNLIYLCSIPAVALAA